MKYQLIGLRNTNKWFDYEYNGDDFDNCFELLFKHVDTKQKYVVKIGLEIGVCGSGYCGAEWLHNEVIEVDNFGPFSYKPKKPVFYNSLDLSGIDNDYIYIYEGGDAYYPSASININYNNFIEMPRAELFKEKKVIYIFDGESGVGKSTIAMRSFDNILETDNPGYMDRVFDFDYDCVVIGNKTGFDKSNYLALVTEFTDKYNFIEVDFKQYINTL